MRKQGGRYRPALLADAVEALLGRCISVRPGCHPLVGKPVASPLSIGELPLESDYKTTLQEHLQAQGYINIEYRLLKSQGPAHAKQFTVGLFVDGMLQAQGSGSSKKEAEKKAAKKLLRKMTK